MVTKVHFFSIALPVPRISCVTANITRLTLTAIGDSINLSKTIVKRAIGQTNRGRGPWGGTDTFAAGIALFTYFRRMEHQ